MLYLVVVSTGVETCDFASPFVVEPVLQSIYWSSNSSRPLIVNAFPSLCALSYASRRSCAIFLLFIIGSFSSVFLNKANFCFAKREITVYSLDKYSDVSGWRYWLIFVNHYFIKSVFAINVYLLRNAFHQSAKAVNWHGKNAVTSGKLVSRFWSKRVLFDAIAKELLRKPTILKVAVKSKSQNTRVLSNSTEKKNKSS